MSLKDKAPKEVLDHVTTRFDYLKAARTDYEDRWRRYYQMYRMAMDPKERERAAKNGRSSLFIPYVYSIVETVKPRVISTMFAARPYMGLVSINPSQQENAEVHTNLMDYQLNQKMSFISVASQVVTSALMYGTGISKQVWKYREKEVKKRKKVLEGDTLTGYNVVKETTVVYDDPLVEYVDIFDFYFDPAIPSIDKQRDVIHRYFVDKDQLKEMADNGVFGKDKLKEVEGGEVAEPTGVESRLQDLSYGVDEDREDRVEILEYWTNDEFVMLANRKIVLVADENPYWHGKKPFSRIIDTEVPGEFCGIGEIEPVEYLQIELNTVRNQRMDNINLIINRMFKVLRAANIDPDQLVSRSGGFIEVDTQDDIEPLEFPDVTMSAYREEEVIKQDMDKTNGVYDYARGASPTRRETATTASILAEASNERFKLKIKLMEDEWLVDVAKQVAELNKQYLDQERLLTLMRDNQIIDVEVSPESLEGEFEFMAIGSAVEPTYNKASKQQALMQLFGVVKDMPFVKLPELIKKMLMAFDIREIHAMLDNEQVQTFDAQKKLEGEAALVTLAAQIKQTQMQVQMMAQQAQMAMMGQQGGPPMMQGGQAMMQGGGQMPPEIMQAIAELPPDIQQKLQGMPPEQIMGFLQQYMGGGMSGQGPTESLPTGA